jgi:hypothetical protein
MGGMAATIIRFLSWAAALWAGAFSALAAQCAWMCHKNPHHQMGMQCWFSERTGLPCDTGTLLLLLLLAISGLWTLVLLHIFNMSRAM